MATIVVHFSTSASSLEPCHKSWEKPYDLGIPSVSNSILG
jgi:hypothetical protein